MRAIRCLACLLAVGLPAQELRRELTGRVVDEQGAPLAGVAIGLIDSRTPWFVTSELVQQPLAVTAADGSYAARLPETIDGDDDRLLFVGKGRVHVRTPLHPHDGWPVVLPRSRTLAGRVVDPAGKPLAGIRVEALDWLRNARYRDAWHFDFLPEPCTAVRTDANGRFVIPGTLDSGIRLLVGIGGKPVKRGPLALGDPIEIVMAAPPPERPAEPRPQRPRAEDPRATVRAVDAEGRPVAAFRAAAMRGSGKEGGDSERANWARFGRSAVDSVDGTARPVLGGRGDTTILLARAPGMAATRLQLADGATDGTVQFVPEVPLQGKVVDASGKPIAGARLWVCRGLEDEGFGRRWVDGSKLAPFDAWLGEAVSDATGAFAVHEIAPGPQHLVCVADGYVIPLPRRIEPAAGTGTTNLVIELTPLRTLTGTTKLAGAPPMGASIRLATASEREAHLAGGLARTGMDSAAYARGAGLRPDGSFRLPAIAPGTYTAQLVLPRSLRQGPPDLVDVMAVTIGPETERIDLDLRPHLPARVRGVVRGPVPAGRLLVGASRECTNHNMSFGYAAFECPLATVAPDGAYEVDCLPGKCTLFVIDLWTGMLLHRDAPRDVAAGESVAADFDVTAGAVDVTIQDLPSEVAWLEMLVPADAWPNGIDRMHISTHEYTKRIGCFLEPGTTSARLWLPPMAADLWLVADRQGNLKGTRGEVAIEVVVGKTSAVTLAFPR